MKIYYNEFDPFAAQWLRNLGAADLIPNGEVDERSIRDVRGADLAGYKQVHFFAGIAGWSLALRIAGWPDDAEVWTGSCPCQPYSVAGAGGGDADERNLWPVMLERIRERVVAGRPVPVIFGEQVASAAGREWFGGVSGKAGEITSSAAISLQFSGVRADLEALGYAVGCADLCAAGVGAPHIRQRLFWGAHRPDSWLGHGHGRNEWRAESGLEQAEPDAIVAAGGAERLADMPSPRCHGAVENAEGQARDKARMLLPSELGSVGGMANGECPERGPISEGRSYRSDGDDGRREETSGGLGDGREDGGLADNISDGRERPSGGRDGRLGQSGITEPAGGGVSADRYGPSKSWSRYGPWSNFYVIACTDGKQRRVGSGVFPLAHGLPRNMGLLQPEQLRLAEVAGLHGKNLKSAKHNRLGRLKGNGNAIAPFLAAEFIMAYLEAR